LGVRLRNTVPPVLAVGGHLKNTVAIGIGHDVFLSQHIGDLDTLEARQAFERAIDDLCRLYSFKPEIVACDLHPDYASTQWAEVSGLPLVRVQHHQAHVAACAAENDVEGPYLGISWDGTGYGLDGAIWGGEFFRVEANKFERISHLRPFQLPGGDRAVREGWRSAASLMFEEFGAASADAKVRRMLERGINVVATTSVGRLFDGIASICGVAQDNRFEGQAAMLLENEIGSTRSEEAYPLPKGNWGPLISAVMTDVRAGKSRAHISVRFHNALVEWILEVAAQAKMKQVVLSGGVFQNRYLVEHAASKLEQRGYQVFTHERVPPNDGGLALGQVIIAGLNA
jgi:hydrogenase maturation protein HypF